MTRIWALACCFGLLVACHQQQTVRREVWPPLEGPKQVVAQTPAPPQKVLDPKVVELSDRSPVMQARRALEKGSAAKARQIAEAALPRASAEDKGRLHWLAAEAASKQGYTHITIAHLDTLGTFRHPLARWARLRRAMLLERRDPEAAATLVASLTDDWAGRDHAESIEARVGPSEESGDLEIRVDATPEALAAKTGRRVQQDFAKGEAFYDSKRYREAQRVFARLARSLNAGSVPWCDARYWQGRSLLQDRERTRGAPVMREVADRCNKIAIDTRAWARYYAGRAYGRIGGWDEAIHQFERLEKEAPEHRLADDASYRAALAELENGQNRAALKRLSSIPERYPEGDMWPRALFRLGWIEFRDGRYENALRHFDELIDKGGDEREEGITGRANYWRARALFSMGRRIDAVEGYLEITKRWPLRYYAQQALWRLGEIHPDRAQAVLAEMRASDSPSRMVFAWRDEFDDPAFERMLELLIVGDVTFASKEMATLGMVGDDVDPKMAVVGAVLLQHAGAEAKLTRVIRSHFEDFEGLLPKGEGKLIWEATYPQAFSPLIERVADDRGIPASFVRAIAREESSFNPDAVSWAKAYGLVQLILPTAKRFSKDAGVKATPRTLKKPDVNLKIGTAYMAWLWGRLEQNLALVPAAYNAGEGAVRRWLEDDSARSLDVFIEEIPYDETRRYTRRVLQTYGVYQWLADEELPALPTALPRAKTQRYSTLR